MLTYQRVTNFCEFLQQFNQLTRLGFSLGGVGWLYFRGFGGSFVYFFLCQKLVGKINCEGLHLWLCYYLHIAGATILNIENPNLLIPKSFPQRILMLQPNEKSISFLRSYIKHSPQILYVRWWPEYKCLLLWWSELEREWLGGHEICQMLGEGLELLLLVLFLAGCWSYGEENEQCYCGCKCGKFSHWTWVHFIILDLNRCLYGF